MQHSSEYIRGYKDGTADGARIRQGYEPWFESHLF